MRADVYLIQLVVASESHSITKKHSIPGLIFHVSVGRRTDRLSRPPSLSLSVRIGNRVR